MVGREDETHFMLPAGWWATTGLVLSLIGVLLLYQSSRTLTDGRPASRAD